MKQKSSQTTGSVTPSPSPKKQSISYRQARVADVDSIEALVLLGFPEFSHFAMPHVSKAGKLKVMAALRNARLHPVEGVFVAENASGEIIGITAGETAQTYTGSSKKRFAALKPLGQLGILRFLFIAKLLLNQQHPKVGEVYIRAAVVKPAYRRFGIAEALLQHVETYASKNDIQSAMIMVSAENKASQTLIKKHGYVPSGTLKRFWRQKLLKEHHFIIFKKNLTS